MRTQTKRGNHSGVPVKFTPPRDRKVRSKAVACPACGVAAEEPCLKLDGTPGLNVHKRRRRLAYEAGHFS